MTRTVSDNALLLEVLAGKDPFDPRQTNIIVEPYTQSLVTDISDIKIGVVKEGFGHSNSEPDVDSIVRQASKQLAELGAQVMEVSIPEHVTGLPIWSTIAMQETTALFQSNGLGYFSKGLYNESLGLALGKSRKVQGIDLPPTLKLSLLMGSYLLERYHGKLYSKAQNLRNSWTKAYDDHLEQVDVLLMPTTPIKAHKTTENTSIRTLLDNAWDMLNNTGPFDITGHPSISIPCGKSNGLPIGMMLTGRHFKESILYRVSHSFEQQINWEDTFTGI